jgi:hypothetical protein
MLEGNMTPRTAGERCAFVLVAAGAAMVWSGAACLAGSLIWGLMPKVQTSGFGGMGCW